MIRNNKGMFLVDVLVLVAVISVLLAISIPQMAAYAVRTQNAAAVTDLRSAVQAQETLKASCGKYGISSYGPPPGPGGYGPGNTVNSLMNPVLTTYDATYEIRGIAITLSNDVTLVSNTNMFDGINDFGVSYTMIAKNNLGDSTFGVDSDSRALYRNTLIGHPNQTMYMLQSADAPSAMPGVLDFQQAMSWMAM